MFYLQLYTLKPGKESKEVLTKAHLIRFGKINWNQLASYRLCAELTPAHYDVLFCFNISYVNLANSDLVSASPTDLQFSTVATKREATAFSSLVTAERACLMLNQLQNNQHAYLLR